VRELVSGERKREKKTIYRVGEGEKRERRPSRRVREEIGRQMGE
jgi:hypothetical protein